MGNLFFKIGGRPCRVMGRGSVSGECFFDFWMSREVVGEFGGGVETWVDNRSVSAVSDDVMYDRKVCATEDERVVCVGVGEVLCDDVFDIDCGAVWIFDGCDEVIGGEIGDSACVRVPSEEVFVDA